MGWRFLESVQCCFFGSCQQYGQEVFLFSIFYFSKQTNIYRIYGVCVCLGFNPDTMWSGPKYLITSTETPSTFEFFYPHYFINVSSSFSRFVIYVCLVSFNDTVINTYLEYLGAEVRDWWDCEVLICVFILCFCTCVSISSLSPLGHLWDKVRWGEERFWHQYHSEVPQESGLTTTQKTHVFTTYKYLCHISTTY